MTHIKQVLEMFDEKFGKPQVDKDGELFFERSVGHSAGCDDCYTNQKEREEHKSFLLSSHTSYLEKQIEWLRGEMARLPEPEYRSKIAEGKFSAFETVISKLKQELDNSAEKALTTQKSVIDHLQEELKEINKLTDNK